MDAVDLIDTLGQMNIPELASATVAAKVEVIADLNAEQLAKGLRTDGSEILPDYKPLTIEIKETQKTGLAAVTDHVTLFDTGEHYRQLYAEVQGDVIEYGSRDEKSAKLQKKYATKRGDIYGLTEDSAEDLVEGHLRGDFIEKFSEQTGL